MSLLSNQIVLRILEAALDEMHLNFFKLELLLEKVNDEILVNAGLARVHVGGEEPALWKRVDADVAFGDNDEGAPAARVLDVIVRRGDDVRLHERAHAKRIAQFGENGRNCFLAIKAFRISAVAINSNVFAKVDCHY